ncbi:hypothetical protein [Streptomyces sp. NPDC088180]|uniref:hypothetical protein n=1 Tax=Streptomyces sp. NPDC088180 TaxID=3365837 RepID=UPI003816C0E9
MLTTDAHGRAVPRRDRHAREGDAGQIAGLQVAAWRAAYAGILPAAELRALDTGTSGDSEGLGTARR